MKNKLGIITLLLLLLLCPSHLNAQLNPQGSGYFLNPYLMNPAYAGIQPGFVFDGALSAQLTSFEGAPFMQAITAAYGATETKVGAGLQFYKERAGVIGRTAIKASYAYHLPLDYDEHFLDLGLSGGINKEQIDFHKVKGDEGDQRLYDFNKRGAYLDGDFGIAFRSNRFTIQGSVPNLRRFLNTAYKEVADRFLYMAGITYHHRSYGSTETIISPMLLYRVIQHEKNIWDAGLNITFQNGKLTGNAIYHSSGSFTGGIGTLYNEQLSILAQFTSNTRDLKSDSNGQFEIAIKYALGQTR